MMVSQPSSTAGLDAATVTLSNAEASAAPTSALRGDNRKVKVVESMAFSPDTMAEVIVPVPMNPMRMIVRECWIVCLQSVSTAVERRGGTDWNSFMEANVSKDTRIRLA